MKVELICVTQLNSLTSHFTATRVPFTKGEHAGVKEDQCEAKGAAYHTLCARFSLQRKKVFPK